MSKPVVLFRLYCFMKIRLAHNHEIAMTKGF